MSLIFPPGKYLTLILLFLDNFFSISPDIVEFPQNKCIIPFLMVLLDSVVVCVTDIFCLKCLDFISCVNLFIEMFHGLLYFNHRTILSFWIAGKLLFGRFIIYNSKIYTRWFTTNGFRTNRCIKFANYWRGFFSFIKLGFRWTELEWCDAVSKFLFSCWCS